MQEEPSTGRWVSEPELDLFSSTNLSAAEHALSRKGALVFGWHYHFKGGSNRTRVQFHDFDSFLRHVERSRPGDHFTLFDLDSLAPHALMRRGAADSPARPTLEDSEWSQLRGLLSDRSFDLAVVRRFVGPLTGTVVTEFWFPDDDEWIEFRRQFFSGLGEALFFSDNVFDLDADGNQVNLVDAYPGRRINALIDAKRPNSEGLVPLRGSY